MVSCALRGLYHAKRGVNGADRGISTGGAQGRAGLPGGGRAMGVTRRPLPGGAEAIRLALPSGASATVLSIGATLHRIEIPDRHGHLANILLSHDDPAAHLTGRSLLGASIGRYANRIANARFMLEGRTVLLDANDGANTLHGGAEGFDRRIWTVLEVQEHPLSLTLGLHSPDGDQGFPGALDATARFDLSEDAQGITLSLRYGAACDQPCPVSLTSHGYFNLAGGGSVLDHRLSIAAGHYLPIRADGIPDGPPRPVSGTPFDFRVAKPVGQDIAAAGLAAQGGYDHNFCPDPADGTPRPVARLSDPGSGRAMTVISDQPGLQLYTANRPPLPGLQAHCALCLEPQAWPDAPNRADFPGTVLHPGASYRHRLALRFTAG